MSSTISTTKEVLIQTQRDIKEHKEKCSNTKPYVTLTYAQSLDGFIAHVSGQPTSISSNESFKFTHGLRALHDGILVGIGTVLADNPSLSVRYGQQPSHPVPIVVDSSLKCPLDSKLVTQVIDTREPLVILTLACDEPKFLHRKECLEERGVCVIQCNDSKKSSSVVDIEQGLRILQARKSINSVMVEGGSSIINSVIHSHRSSPFLNQIILTIAPFWMSGGVPAVQKNKDSHDGAPIRFPNAKTTVCVSEKDVIYQMKF